MKEGLLWYDDNPGRDLAEKIGPAARRYRQKFGTAPGVLRPPLDARRQRQGETGGRGARGLAALRAAAPLLAGAGGEAAQARGGEVEGELIAFLTTNHICGQMASEGAPAWRSLARFCTGRDDQWFLRTSGR